MACELEAGSRQVEEWVHTGRRPRCGASVCGTPAALE